ncbi:MAG: HAMP domain-containing protein, partial [Chloroflexi bacterium]|nr:HAMP domain-containing protein [Chloroflexota bacterium]
IFGRRRPIGDRDFEELLGRLEVRKDPAFVMGLAYPADFIVETGAASRNQQLALFSLVIVLVLIVGLTLAERITRPLRSLVAASRAVAAGDLSAQAVITTEDETGELGGVFNEMIAGLRERERVRDTFGRSMSHEVSDYLMANGVKLGGEKRNVTVMFTDIRGFTGLSERMSPEEVVAMLNGYFAGQVKSIMKFRGRVDKFMGDAILAVFGAPVPFGDHALRAVLAALDMRESLAEFNRQWTSRGRAPIRFGIGINTGEVVVGNIGASERMEYTIIGDVVNTTQRVEDLTKSFGADILLTESTYASVADYIEVGRPRMVTVRGRSTEMAVYPLIRLREEAEVPALGAPGSAQLSAPSPSANIAALPPPSAPPFNGAAPTPTPTPAPTVNGAASPLPGAAPASPSAPGGNRAASSSEPSAAAEAAGV